MEAETEELEGVEQIIGEIQNMMKHQEGPSPFKPPPTQLAKHHKKGWHNKPIKSFSQNEAFSKLEELLLNYKL